MLMWGVVEIRKGDSKKQVEVDFACNQFNKRYYIQSVLSLPTREKTLQEERPLMNIPDNFKKIIVVKDNKKSWISRRRNFSNRIKRIFIKSK